MKKKQWFLFILALASTFSTLAQEVYSPKGRLFIYWGWNRAAYSASDIHFTGENYDFVLHDVTARDRQSPFKLDPYFKLSRISVPQTNLRIGYRFSERYSISFGDDHMKYVMRQYQNSTISGTIATGGAYDGAYAGDDLVLTPEFLIFEHTDGLNYLNLELRRHDEHKRWANQHIALGSVVGFGAGALVPKTNAKLMEKPRNDAYHLAGWGCGLVAGLNITFWEHFFLQSEAKGGFIHMPDVRTSPESSDRASQHFWFVQGNFVFGVNFKLARRVRNPAAEKS